jgi:hypothetical protein
LKTEFVFAAFGVLRWTESVTVTTRATLGPPACCGQINTR